MNQIIWKGLKKTLEHEDLNECPENLKSEQTLKKLKAILKEHEERHGKNNVSLFWMYLRLVGRKLVIAFFVILGNIAAEFFSAVSYFIS